MNGQGQEDGGRRGTLSRKSQVPEGVDYGKQIHPGGNIRVNWLAEDQSPG
jgi:hypothetical protein